MQSMTFQRIKGIHYLVVVRQRHFTGKEFELKPFETLCGTPESVRAEYLRLEALIHPTESNAEFVVAVFRYDDIGDLLSAHSVAGTM